MDEYDEILVYFVQIQIDWYEFTYRQTSNIRRTSVDNKIVDHSDVVGASPVGARLDTWLQYIAQRQLHDKTKI